MGELHTLDPMYQAWFTNKNPDEQNMLWEDLHRKYITILVVEYICVLEKQELPETKHLLMDGPKHPTYIRDLGLDVICREKIGVRVVLKNTSVVICEREKYYSGIK